MDVLISDNYATIFTAVFGAVEYKITLDFFTKHFETISRIICKCILDSISITRLFSQKAIYIKSKSLFLAVHLQVALVNECKLSLFISMYILMKEYHIIIAGSLFCLVRLKCIPKDTIIVLRGNHRELHFQ